MLIEENHQRGGASGAATWCDGPAGLRKYAIRNRRRVYLISFPKCGRTWFRVLLGRVIQQHFAIKGLPSYRKLLKVKMLAKYHPDASIQIS